MFPIPLLPPTKKQLQNYLIINEKLTGLLENIFMNFLCALWVLSERGRPSEQKRPRLHINRWSQKVRSSGKGTWHLISRLLSQHLLPRAARASQRQAPPLPSSAAGQWPPAVAARGCYWRRRPGRRLKRGRGPAARNHISPLVSVRSAVGHHGCAGGASARWRPRAQTPASEAVAGERDWNSGLASEVFCRRPRGRKEP